MTRHETSTTPWTRRAFAQRLAACVPTWLALMGRRSPLAPTVAAIAATSTGAACASVRFASASVDGRTLRIPLRELSTAGVLVDMPGDPLPLLLRRLDDNRIIALSTRCTHRGCQVEPARRSLVCPCHGSEFDLEGGVINGPAERPLTRYATRLDATHVIVDLEPSPSGAGQ